METEKVFRPFIDRNHTDKLAMADMAPSTLDDLANAVPNIHIMSASSATHALASVDIRSLEIDEWCC